MLTTLKHKLLIFPCDKSVYGITKYCSMFESVRSAAGRAHGGGRLATLTQGGCAARLAHPASRAHFIKLF